jgi:hypothetical protein
MGQRPKSINLKYKKILEENIGGKSLPPWIRQQEKNG